MTDAAPKPDVSVLGDMPHLTEAREDAAKAIKKRLAQDTAAKAEAAEQEDPKTQEEYTFSFAFTDRRGKDWKGKFTNKILTNLDRQAIGNLQAVWQGGQPHDSFNPNVAGLNYILAHMRVSLTPADDVKWAKDLRALHSSELLQALYDEVDSHEATFHGYPKTKAGSEANG